MKRILSLVLAMVMVLGSFSAVFAAELTAAEKAGAFLKEVDVLRGTTDSGDLDLEEDLRREEAIVVLSRLMDVEETAKGFPTEGLKFEDITNEGYKGYIQWAYANGYTTGKSDVKFGFKEALTAQHFATFILRALGYDVTGEAYVNALETAKDLGILGELELENKTELKRGMMAVMTFNALSVNVKDSEKTLAETLEIVMPVVEPEVPAALEVKEVVANNLKTMNITFNQEVDKDTITSTTVKVVKAGANVVVARTLLEDNKTLVVELSGIIQSDTVTLTVEGVKNVAKDEVVKFTQAYVLNDVTIPVLLGVSPLNAKQIELVFSEPVQMSQTLFTLWSDIKVGGNAIVAKATPNNAKNTILITLSTALAEGTHTIEVKNVKDYANFVVPTATLDFTVVKDDKAPVALSVEVKSKTSVVVKFDEPVLTMGQFKVDNVDRTGTTTLNALGTEATITGLNLGVSAIVEVKVEYKGQKDIMGNEVKEWTSIITKVEDNTTLPTVELTSVGAGNKLTFTFSKSMAVAGKVQILNNKDVVKEEITITTFKSSDNKVLEITPSILASVNPGDYTAKLVDMKDSTIRENALPTNTIAFKAIDTLAPTVEAKSLATAGKDADGTPNTNKDTITIYFSEAMDVATIENLANYFVGGQPMTTLAAAVSAKAAADAKSVVITYVNANSTPPTVIVYSVKDAAGNIMTPASGTTVTAQTAAGTRLQYTSAKAIDKNTVEVTFDTPISSVDPSLLVVHDGTQVVTNFVSATVKATNTKVVVFKTATPLNTATAAYELRIASPSSIKNIYNKSLTTAGTDTEFVSNAILTIAGALTDEISPELVSVTAVAAPVTNQFVIKFSEVVTATTLGDIQNDLIIKYANGSLVTAYSLSNIQSTPSTDLIVTLAPNASLANGSNAITVQLFADRYLKDAYNNMAVPFEAKSVTVVADALAPTVSGVTYTLVTAGTYAAGDKITIKFSETVTTLAAIDLTTTGNLDDSTLTITGDTVVIELKNGGAALSLATGNTITIPAAKVLDTVGNVMAVNYVITLP